MSSGLINPSGLTALGRFGSLGITLALGVAFFVWLGSLIDQRFGTAPWGVAGLGLLGAVASLVKLVRDVQRLSAEQSADEAELDRKKD